MPLTLTIWDVWGCTSATKLFKLTFWNFLILQKSFVRPGRTFLHRTDFVYIWGRDSVSTKCLSASTGLFPHRLRTFQPRANQLCKQWMYVAHTEVPSASIVLTSPVFHLEPDAVRLHPGLQTLPAFCDWKMQLRVSICSCQTLKNDEWWDEWRNQRATLRREKTLWDPPTHSSYFAIQVCVSVMFWDALGYSKMTVLAPDDRVLETVAGRKTAEYEYKCVANTFRSVTF